MLNQLQEELKIAMKDRDKAAMIGLRNIIGKLNASQIDKGEDLNEEESLKILKSAAKQLKESVEQYNKGGREDLAEKQLFELSLIKKYLPDQLLKLFEETDLFQNLVCRALCVTGLLFCNNTQ